MTTADDALPWKKETQDEAETRDWGRRLAALCPAGARVRLLGDLGAGKTTFTRGLAAGLGAAPGQVHSPSYSLVHLYRDAATKPVLYHVDLYRVEGMVDLEEIGLEEVFASPVPAAVEWPERLRGSRYQAHAGDLEVNLTVLGRGKRGLEIRRL
jgi:tRNA threonylcarbamoyladenosine biosynthesis protein TsaE